MRSLRFWFLPAGYSAIIFAISSIPGDALKAITIWDKLLHTIEYAPLGFLLLRAIDKTWPQAPRALVWLAAAGLATMYGLSDEFHQGFVFGREVSAYDAIADGIGAGLGAGILLIFSQFRERSSHVSR